MIAKAFVLAGRMVFFRRNSFGLNVLQKMRGRGGVEAGKGIRERVVHPRRPSEVGIGHVLIVRFSAN